VRINLFQETGKRHAQSCVVNSQLFQKLKLHLQPRHLKSEWGTRNLRGKR